MTRRRVHVVIECFLVLAVFAATYRVAARYVAAVDRPSLADWELKPAVMLSCGFGFVEPGGISPDRERFLLRKSGSISCQQFSWGGAPTPGISIAEDNRYSIYGVAWALKLGGTSWDTIDAYLAALFALSMSAIYGTYRMAVGRLLALAGVAALACSTTLSEIIVLRDFVKMPCFSILWFGLAWVIKSGFTRGASGMVLPLVLSGAVVGWSIGLRMDALIFLPVFPAVAALAIPGFTRRELAFKAVACGAFVAAFLATGVPILRSLSGGSNSSHVVVLGLMQDFDYALGIVSTPYDIGRHYSDGFAYSVIASHGLLKEGAKMPIHMGTAKYDAIGNRLIAAVARAFPANFMARALAATAQIFRYSFNQPLLKHAEKLPTFQDSPTVRVITRWRTKVLRRFGGRELIVTLAVLVLAAAFNWRLAPLGVLLVLYFCGYAMVQFARRHAFHLDVIPMFVVILAVHLPLVLGWHMVNAFWRGHEEGLRTGSRVLRELGIGAAAILLLLLAGAGALAAARHWQQGHVATMLDRTIASEWTEETTADEPLASITMIGDRPSATWWPLYIERPDLWNEGVLIRVNGIVRRGQESLAALDVRLQYFMVVLSADCGRTEVTLTPAYTAAEHTADWEYLRPFTIPVSRSAASRLLMPAYYHLGSRWNRFDGFAVPEGQRACVTGVFRAVDPSSLPMPVMVAALGPDWRDRPLYTRVLSQPEGMMVGASDRPALFAWLARDR